MSRQVIDNPIINSPFKKPIRHFKFDQDGITSEIVETRRKSSYFTPIPKPKKKKGQQTQLSLENWTSETVRENELINQIRQRVDRWRQLKYPSVTKTTKRLLEYWTSPEREKPLFFCQIEAIETMIYITEVAKSEGDSWIENQLRDASNEANPDVFRIAMKMATGTGKTVLMAMLIAWQALNKIDNPRSSSFTDAFLIVAPGITIRDRLRVLLPNDAQNYYQQRDVLPYSDILRLGHAKIIITNFHSFLRRETISAGKLTKEILSGGDENSPFLETPDQMVRRVCRELGNKKNIIVINDEAHHCYRHKVEDTVEENFKGKTRKVVEEREENARVWISGIEAIQKKIGVRVVYDLSATPFFLQGSGYPEGTLFPWVVSDFSLIDAIESGIVKIPRVPVADDAMTGDLPTYRGLWQNISDKLPKKLSGSKKGNSTPKLPVELEGALRSLYSNYESTYQLWEEKRHESQNNDEVQNLTPPVMIVVCNNTVVSKMVFDWISGYDKSLKNGDSVIIPGNLPVFRNGDGNRWFARPNTILVDSQELESGGMSKAFKTVAEREIEAFKEEYRLRYPDRDIGQITDEDLMREVMNTVGKVGRLGEHVKCVVSVSMLTEGWDANTVTHILGVRAFSTQLICEQVVGRGLRRINYVPDENGMFEAEYAEIYGVPFSFIPTSGSSPTPKLIRKPYNVHAMEDRAYAEITFPKVIGYRYEIQDGELKAEFTSDAHMTLSTQDVPTMTETSSIFGESNIHSLEDLESIRPQAVAFELAKLVLERFFTDDDGNVKNWYFPRLLQITKDWMLNCVEFKDGTFIQMLSLTEFATQAAEHIYRSISFGSEKSTLKPILDLNTPIGSSSNVNFDTLRTVYETASEKCHVNYVALDSDDWEAKMAQALESMDEVSAYVKNDGLGFYIPYTLDGNEKNYQPDFIVQIKVDDEIVNLIIEVTGQRRKAKVVKVDTARKLWLPAVNNHGGFGRWEFIEITDPWNAKNIIRTVLGTENTMYGGNKNA